MNARGKLEELLETSKDGTITAGDVTKAGLHRSIFTSFSKEVKYTASVGASM